MCWWMTTSSHARRHGGDQVEQLVAIQVVGGGDARGALVAEPVDGQFVGGVEREIGDDGHALLAEEMPGRRGCGPGSPSAPCSGQGAEDAHLARLLDARRGQGDRRAARHGRRPRPRDTGGCRGNRRSRSRVAGKDRFAVGRASGRARAGWAVRRPGAFRPARSSRARIAARSESASPAQSAGLDAGHWRRPAAAPFRGAACPARSSGTIGCAVDLGLQVAQMRRRCRRAGPTARGAPRR